MTCSEYPMSLFIHNVPGELDISLAVCILKMSIKELFEIKGGS